MDKVSRVLGRWAPVGGDWWCFAIGFSARALAEALRDAGFRVIAVDGFGDKDLKESAKVPQILSNWGAPGEEKTLQTDRWSFYSGLPNETATDAPLPVFLAGGCENWPELLEFLSREPLLRLIGPSPQEIQDLRDPLVWQKACIGCDVEFPDSYFPGPDWDGETVPGNRSWTGHGSVSVSPSARPPNESAVSPASVSPTPVSSNRSWTGHGSASLSPSPRPPSESAVSPALANCESAVSLPGALSSAVSPPGALSESAVSPALANCQSAVSPSGGKERWLWKKRSTGGGLGVLRAESFSPRAETKGCYLQQFVEGRCLGASFLIQSLAHCSSIDVQLIGVTESWNCSDWPAGSEFLYRGSFGPVEISARQRLAAQALILALLQNCGSAGQNSDLSTKPQQPWNGWLQVDLIESPDGQLWLLEVNPRWTAGMEVLRLSGQANMAALHAKVNGVTPPPQPNGVTPSPQPPPSRPQPASPLACPAPPVNSEPSLVVSESNPAKPSAPSSLPPACQPAEWWIGKAIYYAPSPVQLDEQKLRGLQQLLGQGFSDIPSDDTLGSCIEAGHPVLTITATIARKQFEGGSSDEAAARHEILQQLHAKRSIVDRLLGVLN